MRSDDPISRGNMRHNCQMAAILDPPSWISLFPLNFDSLNEK